MEMDRFKSAIPRGDGQGKVSVYFWEKVII